MTRLRERLPRRTWTWQDEDKFRGGGGGAAAVLVRLGLLTRFHLTTLNLANWIVSKTLHLSYRKWLNSMTLGCWSQSWIRNKKKEAILPDALRTEITWLGSLYSQNMWALFLPTDNRFSKKKIWFKKELGNISFLKYMIWLVGFYGISTFVGYLTPNPFLYK